MTTSLARRLGLRDAVLIGLGSMIGAGIYSAFGPATAAAGTAVLISLLLAGAIAYCNAVATAQLAAQYPSAGGTYVYGRERLSPTWGFLAGWGFVIGKTASCAAMALTLAVYVLPSAPTWAQRGLAIIAVWALTALNYRGITRTAAMTRWIVMMSLSLLAVWLVLAWVLPGSGSGESLGLPAGAGGVLGVLQGAGLLFFAFAGYARIATLGEEVRDPSVVIPRAIPLALGLTLLVYLLIGVTLLVTTGAEAVAATPAPLAAVVEGTPWTLLVQVGAAVAALGALLSLIAGVSRTSFAMARERDLPTWLDSVHDRYEVPHRAELVVAVAVTALLLVTDLRGAIGFSSFGVLVYYAIANAAAYTQTGEHRRWPKWLNVIGLIGSLVLVVTLPWQAVLGGVAVFAIGLVGRTVLRRES